MGVVGSAGIILSSCVVRALAAGGLRTTYTFKVRNPEKNLPSRYKPGSRKTRDSGALNCGFGPHSCAELRHSRKTELESRYALREASRHPENRALRAVTCSCASQGCPDPSHFSATNYGVPRRCRLRVT